MENIHYVIEDENGLSKETTSLEVAEKEYLKGHRVTEVKTLTTYTEHTKIVLKTYEDKTAF